MAIGQVRFSLYLCTAMRKLEHMRTVVAILLLSVVLPMTLVLPFHHHDVPDQEEFSCELCEHHQPHPAHLSSSDHPDNCLICQFLGIGFLPEASAEVVAVIADGSDCRVASSQDAPSVQLELLSTRAPPFSFC